VTRCVALETCMGSFILVLYNLLHNSFRVLKSKSMECSGHIAVMEKPQNIPTVLCGKLEGK